MVMAHVQPIAINYAMFVNRFATNALKTAQIRSWWYEALAMINPAQRNSDPPRAYIVSAKWIIPTIVSSVSNASG